MASFYEIMQQQKMESYYNQPTDDELFEQELQKALAQSLLESTQESTQTTHDDEKLARLLQEEENLRYHHENKTYNVKDMAIYEQEVLKGLYTASENVYEEIDDFEDYDGDDDYDQDSDEFEMYYDKVEPRDGDEDSDEQLFAFDSAQREEDREIAGVVKSHYSKRTNSIPTPLHHKDFSTRQGKDYRGRTKQKVEKKVPLKEPGYEYGKVVNTLGGRRFDVVTTEGTLLRCFVLKKARFVFDNDIVLIRLREYQPGKGDIVYNYTFESKVPYLMGLNEITEDDFNHEVDPSEIDHTVPTVPTTTIEDDLLEAY